MSRLRTALLPGLVALALLAGCGGDEEATSATTAADTTTTTGSQSGTGSQGAGTEGDNGTAEEAGAVLPEPESGSDEIDLYFTSGEQFETVPRKQPQGSGGIRASSRRRPTRSSRARRRRSGKPRWRCRRRSPPTRRSRA